VKSRAGIETSVICVSAVLVLVVVVAGAAKMRSPLIIPFVAIPLVAWLWHLTSGSKAARGEVTSGEQYRQLADEYRRLADLAITAQEHTDLKLGDVSVRIDYLGEQMESLQKILKEVE
jgi:hypothetical protein